MIVIRANFGKGKLNSWRDAFVPGSRPSDRNENPSRYLDFKRSPHLCETNLELNGAIFKSLSATFRLASCYTLLLALDHGHVCSLRPKVMFFPEEGQRGADEELGDSVGDEGGFVALD